MIRIIIIQKSKRGKIEGLRGSEGQGQKNHHATERSTGTDTKGLVKYGARIRKRIRTKKTKKG